VTVATNATVKAETNANALSVVDYGHNTGMDRALE